MNYLVAVYGFKVNQSELDDLLLASFLEKNEIFRLHFNRIYPKSKLKFQHSNIQKEPCSRCQLYCKCTLYTECCDVIRLLLDSEVVTWCFIVDTWNSQWKFSSGSLPGAGAGVSDLVSDLLYICNATCLHSGKLTHSLCQAKDLLIVGVCFIPDEGVGEVGERREGLLELTAHDGHHQVHLHQAKGQALLGQQHLQDGLVASGPGAQVDQVEVTAWYGHLLVKDLMVLISSQTGAKYTHSVKCTPHSNTGNKRGASVKVVLV